MLKRNDKRRPQLYPCRKKNRLIPSNIIYKHYIIFSGNNANPTVGCASGLFGGLNGNSNGNGGMTSVTSLGSRISQFRHSMRAGSTNGSNNSTSPGNYALFL